MDLQVNLSGEAERFIVEASGKTKPGLSTHGMHCSARSLESGVRNPNLTADQQGSGLKDSLPGAVDALWRVSGMDERVGAIFRLSTNSSSPAVTLAHPNKPSPDSLSSKN